MNFAQLKWQDSLGPSEVETWGAQAESLIKFTAQSILVADLTKGSYLRDKAACLLAAFRFLSRGDDLRVLNIICQILSINERGRCSIQIKTELRTFCVTVCDIHVFGITSVTAFKLMGSACRRENPNAYHLVRNICIHLFEYVDVKSEHSVFVAKIILNLIKDFRIHSDLEASEQRHLCLIYSVCNGPVHSNASDVMLKVLEHIVNGWQVEKALRFLRDLVDNYSWDSFCCHIASILLKKLETVELKFCLPFIVKRIANMLMYSNFNSGVLKLLTSVISHVNIETWTEEFLPMLGEYSSANIDKREAFVKGSLMECISIMINEYGINLYSAFKNTQSIYQTDSEKCWYFIVCNIIILRLSVLKNVMIIDNFRVDIEKLYYVGLAHNYAQFLIPVLTYQRDKHMLIPTWRLNLLSSFLKHIMCAADRNQVFKDFKMAVSHFMVNANANVAKFDDLIDYECFIEQIYLFCIEGITSRSPDTIGIASAIWEIMESTFNRKSSDNRDKNQFVLHLIKSKRWPFAHQATLKTLLDEFEANEKVFLEIYSRITQFIEYYEPSSMYFINECFELLDNQCDYESVIKGTLYAHITLSSKIGKKDTKSFIIGIIEKWLKRANLLLKRFGALWSMRNIPIFGYTNCVVSLLNGGYFNFSEYSYTYSCFVYTFKSIIMCMLDSSDAHNTFNPCLIKAVEHTIVLSLEGIVSTLKAIDADCPYKLPLVTCALQVCCEVIRRSDMKRPVTGGAAAVQQICQNIVDDDSEECLLKFAEYVLHSIDYQMPNKSSKIRRTPEHRLIIHSIVKADQRNRYPLFSRCIQYLLKTLFAKRFFNDSIVSSLNTIEILLSDNNLCGKMLPYINSLGTICINELSNEDWKIRNASIQVFQSLINKFFGQRVGLSVRRNNVEEFTDLFPELMNYFYYTLCNCNRRNTVIGILAFFSESHPKCKSFIDPSVNALMDKFVRLFLKLAFNNALFVGQFAAQAFISTYSHKFVPHFVKDLTDWIIEQDLTKIDKNVFYICYFMLKNLDQKFKKFTFSAHYKKGSNMLQKSFRNFYWYLEKYKYKYECSLFSMLSIQFGNIDQLAEKIVKLKINDRFAILWLRMSASYILLNCNFGTFLKVLQVCLNYDLLFLDCICLDTIITRFSEIIQQRSVLQAIFVVVLKVFFKKIFHSCQFIIVYFSKVLHLFLETNIVSVDEDIFNLFRTIREDIQHTKNVYIICVCFTLLSFMPHLLSTQDVCFLNYAISIYEENVMVEDGELQWFLGSSWKYLARCCQEPSQMRCVLRLAFILLFSEECSIELRQILSKLFGFGFLDTYLVCGAMLSYEWLLHILLEPLQVCLFYHEMTMFVLLLNKSYFHDDTFYMTQNHGITFYKTLLKRLLLEKLMNAQQFFTNRESYYNCLKYFVNLLVTVE